MPTQAGQRCSRYPSRLHRTASLHHSDSVESGSSINESEDSSHGGIGSANGSEFQDDIHDGTTPVVADTPEDAQEPPRSTPCPGGEARPAGRNKRAAPVNPHPAASDIDMPDAPPLTPSGEIEVPSGYRSAVLGPQPPVPNPDSLLRRALHNATDRNLRARLRLYEMADDVEGYETWSAKLRGQCTRIDARLESLEEHIAGIRLRGTRVQALFVLIVLVLFYACFCWFHWPEMSYIRDRRRQVLGL
ncbi:hypothetical protein CKM354_000880600 [Cercospora kikuchii]|uniref:Uncharacterized protein n=1 Tax=Cercospora kikuchii TaxID=84275 RepID=A0A9P3CMQ5_9PEZI|nr:uncharacterized protein CKM354_000880600 [Cercospora kikuchii]GIZ45649.1 hypothetical protein CKM354_000880600 [Cercospora kikuchii]